MTAQQSSILPIAPDGWRAALKAEPSGLFASITHFRVAKLSSPEERSAEWGTTVYYGAINDYELVDPNVILFTLVVPPEIDTAEIDSLALYLADGTIWAQDMLKRSRRKNASSMLYIHAYINAPEPAELIEIALKSPATLLQVEDYCDLPAANETKRFEAIVNNGHCGAREDSPTYLPMMAVLSSAQPKTPLYPPNEPFLDPDVGILGAGLYRYTITARNSSGESLPSAPHKIQLLQLPTPTAYIERGFGALATGTHYYSVVAISPGGGKTAGSTEVSLAVTKLDTPAAPTISVEAGGLQAGTYYWAVSAISAYGETLISTATGQILGADSGVEVSWTAVSGAAGYVVYRGDSPATLKKIAEVAPEFLLLEDWGMPADNTRSPVPEATDCGNRVMWDRIEGAVGYEVYGRITGGGKERLAVLPEDQFFFDDVGDADDGTAMPLTNNTSSGVEVKWSLLPGATEYSVYGRTIYVEGLLGTVGASTTSFIDDGSIVPGAAAPTENTTSAVEWQLLDGTLLYRGHIDTASLTSVTLATPLIEQNWDVALLVVSENEGRYQTRHIRWNTAAERFDLLDRPFDTPLNPGSSIIAIWAGPGCCGGNCGDELGVATLFPAAPPTPDAPPPYAKLGAHFSGNYLGQLAASVVQQNDINYRWASAASPDRIRSGFLDQVFCDENGRAAYDIPLNNRVQTPHGDRLPPGQYSSFFDAAPNSVRFTFDALAIPEGIRVIIYSGQNFTGNVLLDVEGPFYMANWIYRDDPRFSWGVSDAVWSGLAGEIIPAGHRYWSDKFTQESIQNWKIGSIQVLRTFL